MTHPCPVRPCRVREVPDHLLMCGQHWRLVPAALKTAVYAAYDGPGSVGTPELMRAQADAIKAVHARLVAS